MKHVFSNKSDVRLGFEVECCIRTQGITKFYKAIKALGMGVQTGSDGSINTTMNTRPIEIRTAPLPPGDAMECLRKVFDIVNEYGFTNPSCGLHVNISSVKQTKMRSFNPLPFLSSRIWNQILTKFKRGNNGYCRTHLRTRGRPSKVTILKHLTQSMDDKYRCVTFCNWGTGKTKSSRIEVRGFGNRHYTKKYQTISTFVKRIVKLFNLSCNNRPIAPTFNV
jgi:hypothetical protein